MYSDRHTPDHETARRSPAPRALHVASAPATGPLPLRVRLHGTSELVWSGLSAMLDARRDRVELLRGDFSGGPARGPDLGSRPRLDVRVDVEVVDATDVVDGTLIRGLSRSGSSRVLLTSWHPSPRTFWRARAVGADGLLPMKGSANAMVAVLQQEHPQNAAQYATTHSSSGPGSPREPARTSGPDRLTDREYQVITMICEGRSNQEIADLLFLSINTIKTCIRSAYHKIGVTSRTQAVRWGLDHRC